MTGSRLAQVLPYSAAELRQSMYSLHALGLVAAAQGRWRVSPLAYTAVRQFIAGEEYLVDAMQESGMDQKTELNQILYDIGQINFIQISLIAAAAWLLIALRERLFPGLAEKMPGRWRMYFMPSVPVLRLLIILTVLALIIPLVTKPEFQNLVAILGQRAWASALL